MCILASSLYNDGKSASLRRTNHDHSLTANYGLTLMRRFRHVKHPEQKHVSFWPINCQKNTYQCVFLYASFFVGAADSFVAMLRGLVRLLAETPALPRDFSIRILMSAFSINDKYVGCRLLSQSQLHTQPRRPDRKVDASLY
jgi:hypothetical protein